MPFTVIIVTEKNDLYNLFLEHFDREKNLVISTKFWGDQIEFYDKLQNHLIFFPIVEMNEIESLESEFEDGLERVYQAIKHPFYYLVDFLEINLLYDFLKFLLLVDEGAYIDDNHGGFFLVKEYLYDKKGFHYKW